MHRYGCVWSKLEKSTLKETTELNTEYLRLLKYNSAYFSSLTQPLLCKIIDGEMKSQQFSITGKNESEFYGLRTNKVLIKLKDRDEVVSKGCVIVKCDALTAYNNIPNEDTRIKIRDMLNN